MRRPEEAAAADRLRESEHWHQECDTRAWSPCASTRRNAVPRTSACASTRRSGVPRKSARRSPRRSACTSTRFIRPRRQRWSTSSSEGALPGSIWIFADLRANLRSMTRDRQVLINASDSVVICLRTTMVRTRLMARKRKRSMLVDTHNVYQAQVLVSPHFSLPCGLPPSANSRRRWTSSRLPCRLGIRRRSTTGQDARASTRTSSCAPRRKSVRSCRRSWRTKRADLSKKFKRRRKKTKTKHQVGTKTTKKKT